MFTITDIQKYSCPELAGMPPETVFAPFSGISGSVLLLSGKGTGAEISVIGLLPAAVVHDRNNTPVLDWGSSTIPVEDPLETIERILSDIPAHVNPEPGLGALGYISYDYRRRIEILPDENPGPHALPDICFTFSRIILVYHLNSGEWERYEISYSDTDDADWKHILSAIREYRPGDAPSLNISKLKSSFTREQHCSAVERTRDYIIEGDIYQANISRQCTIPLSGDPYPLFLEIFRRNPAPYFAYLNFEDHAILSSSPELLLKIEERQVLSEPIKGTSPRFTDPEQDRKSKESLLHSLKDDAELSMIVDLIRNDLGKICSPGSVKVGTHREIRSYSNVHHTHSEVVGILEQGTSLKEIIHAVFPGGSITGCPKIRSMEIIDEIETVQRHIYTGSIGWIGPGGSMVLNIAIRTALVHEGLLSFSAGGGIVYDSDGENEFEETADKAQTWLSLFKELGRGSV